MTGVELKIATKCNRVFINLLVKKTKRFIFTRKKNFFLFCLPKLKFYLVQ